MNPCNVCKRRNSPTACPYAGTRGSGKEVNGCHKWEPEAPATQELLDAADTLARSIPCYVVDSKSAEYFATTDSALKAYRAARERITP
jgi:hypothetical protein